MKLLSFIMPRDFNLYQWGDTHEGTRFQLNNGVENFIETVMGDKLGYCFHVGDWAESRTIDHPYYVHSHARVGSATVLEQLEVVKKQFMPLAKSKKLLWINKGNHEKSVDNFGNTTEALCQSLGIEYGTWTSKVSFFSKRRETMFKGYWTHGFNRVHSLSSQAQDPKLQKAHAEMKLKKMLYPMAGDCIIMGCGHYHRLLVNEPSRELFLHDDGKKIKQGYTKHVGGDFIHQDLRWYCCSGAFYRQFLDGYDSYSEMAGHRPTELGYIKIHVRDGEIKRVEPVVVS